jgi:hypothetical protein
MPPPAAPVALPSSVDRSASSATSQAVDLKHKVLARRAAAPHYDGHRNADGSGRLIPVAFSIIYEINAVMSKLNSVVNVGSF